MLNPMDLSGRNILLTGASSGIGRETALLLSELGASLILVGRKKDQLDKTYAMLKKTIHRIETFDLTAVDEIPRWIKNIAAEVGPLYGMVHSAGVQFLRPLQVTSSKSFYEIMVTNVSAAIGLSKGFSQRSVRGPTGSIVFLSSTAGIVAQPGCTDYSASKGALISLTKTLALELAKEKIRVNCVAPAMVQTEMVDKFRETVTSEQFEAIEAMHPLGIGTPRDVANAIAFLLADTGRWITGTTLVVDGGLTAH